MTFLKTETPPKPILTGFGVSEAITVGHVLSDGEIIGQLERQFPSDQLAVVQDVAHSNLHSSINEAYPSLWTRTNSEAPVLVNTTSLVDTMAPGLAADDAQNLLSEPDLPHGEPRPFTYSEAKIVLSALRLAARVPGHRLDAINVLSQFAPSRVERAASQAALSISKHYLPLRRAYKYKGRHLA